MSVIPGLILLAAVDITLLTFILVTWRKDWKELGDTMAVPLSERLFSFFGWFIVIPLAVVFYAG